VIVRRLKADELHLAVPILTPEGWTLEKPDLERLHALGGAVGGFDGDKMVGFLTFLDTPPLRWIGNVAVAASARGKGVGARIVAEAMRDAPRTALYSVEKAVTLYARAGLVPRGMVHSLRALEPRGKDGRADALAKGDIDGIVALDRAATGMDRSRLLRALSDAFPTRVVQREGRIVGFGIAKAYPDVTEIGPVVAESPADAWAIVDELIASTPPPYDVAVHGLPARGWGERSFSPLFRAIPMFRGAPPAWDLNRYLAASGLEKG